MVNPNYTTKKYAQVKAPGQANILNPISVSKCALGTFNGAMDSISIDDQFLDQISFLLDQKTHW